jgi:hypothetical protein
MNYYPCVELDSGSFEGDLFFVVSGSTQSLHLGETARHRNGQMLHVQEKWRVCGPPFSSL